MINTTDDIPRTITAYFDDDWECACHNTARDSGFEPCSPDGRILDFDLDSDQAEWDGKLYCCSDCGLVIDHTTFQPGTMAVVGRIDLEDQLGSLGD